MSKRPRLLGLALIAVVSLAVIALKLTQADPAAPPARALNEPAGPAAATNELPAQAAPEQRAPEPGDPHDDHVQEHRPLNMPAFTPEEEIYLAKLRPIHQQVKYMTLSLAGASLDLGSGRMDPNEYRGIVQRARQTYQGSQEAVAGLDVPPSLSSVNSQFLDIIDHYLSATAVLERVADGDRRHLAEAIPSLRAGTQSAQELALTLWPDEYIPN